MYLTFPRDCKDIKDLGKILESKSIRIFYYYNRPGDTEHKPPDLYLCRTIFGSPSFSKMISSVTIHYFPLSSIQFSKIFSIIEKCENVLDFQYIIRGSKRRPNNIKDTFFPIVSKYLKLRNESKPMKKLIFYCLSENFIKGFDKSKVYYICSQMTKFVKEANFLVAPRYAPAHSINHFVTAQITSKTNTSLRVGSLSLQCSDYFKKFLLRFNVTC